ncbi:MAG: hypothetical protein ACRCS8_06065 [Brevinema sp.]
MKKTIKKLIPSAVFAVEKKLCLHNSLICIHIDDDSFYITINYTYPIENIHTILSEQLKFLFPKNEIIVARVDGTPIDPLIKETVTLYLELDRLPLNLIISIDFLTYLSKKFERIPATYRASTILDLQRELFRFQPALLPSRVWKSFSEKDLASLFNQMLSSNLVSLQMLAIFFHHSKLHNPSLYFSRRVGEDIRIEMRNIIDLPKSLTTLIYFIMERNILLFFKQNQEIPTLQYYQRDYQTQLWEHFLTPRAQDLVLKELNFIKKHYDTSKFYLLINQLPYDELLSFLKVSPSENLEIVSSGFSKEGQKKLQDDLQKVVIKPFSNLLEKFGVFEAECSHMSTEDLIRKHIKTGRDWEFLAREISLLDFVRLYDEIDPTLTKNISPILFSLVSHYKNKQLHFPQSTPTPMNSLYSIVSAKINYLKLLSII